MGSGVVLRLNLAFLPKVLSEFHLSQSVKLQLMSSSDRGLEAEQCQPLLCPVWALAEYIQCMQAIRKIDQLFACFNSSHLGRPLSKPRLLWTQFRGHMPSWVCLSHLEFGPTQLVVWLRHGPCGGELLSIPYVQQPHGHLGPPFPDSTF
eukprot:superscaffoldBa00000005_g99